MPCSCLQCVTCVCVCCLCLGRQNDNKERDELRTYDKGTLISYMRGCRTYLV
jgi:hypothetical protein